VRGSPIDRVSCPGSAFQRPRRLRLTRALNPELALLLVRILLVALLYTFLGAIFLITWRDLRRASPAGPTRQQHPGRILVADPGPASGLAAGASFPLLPANTFGRAPTNTICVEDETVSLVHARLSMQGEHWLLEDTNSRNGTRLNGTRVDTPTVVTPEDVFEIGRVSFRLEFE